MKRWPLHKAYYWETAPFFRILLPFIAGILAYETGLSGVPGFASLAVLLVSFVLYVFVFRDAKSTGRQLATFSLVAMMLFVGGVALSYFNDIRHDKAWFGNAVDHAGTYLVRITGDPVEKEHSWKLPLAVISDIRDGKVATVTGNAFVYLYKSTLPMMLKKGDSLLVPGKLEPIRNAGNPFEFDYATYARRNGIALQQFCSMNNVRLFATGDPGAESATEKVHEWCMTQLDTYIGEHKAKGLIQAMLIGDEVNLDDDLRQSYSQTGIIHITAISGGNVAIFFVIISALLSWIKHKKHLWVKYAAALPLVWFYVLMAGAPPSAVRAAVMFSLLAISVMMQKNNNSLNQLFATAFVLLCAQPMWLFSVGFQLSFVAVLSLILFYAPVYALLSPVNKIARLLWGCVAASIAAEVLVAPLVIYYFHTFPLLFIVANVAAYLFMSVVLVLGIAIIACSGIPVLANALGVAAVWLVTVFDKLVAWLQGYNPPSFQFLVLTGTELILSYVFISCVILFLWKQKKPAMFAGLAAACLLVASYCGNEWTLLHQKRIVVYNNGKENHVELINGTHYNALTPDTAKGSGKDYVMKNAHICWQAWCKDSTITSELLDVNGKSFLVLNEDIQSDSVFHVDYLLVNYSGTIDLARLQHIFSPEKIIIGNNYPRSKQEQMVTDARSVGVQIHAVALDGAFVLE